MTERATLAALLARVLEGTGPDRALDKAILASMGFTWRGMAYWHHDEKTMWRGKTFFTASLDDAITLVPDRWAVELVQALSGSPWHAKLRGGSALVPIIGATAATPPRALIAACLKARMEAQGD